MRKALTLLVAALMVTGFSAAVVGNDAPADKPSITENGPDQKGDLGPGDKRPADMKKGPVDKAKGLAMAASKVPGDVANAIIGPLQNGVTGLGNMFDLGSLLGGSEEPANSTENGTDNTTE